MIMIITIKNILKLIIFLLIFIDKYNGFKRNIKPREVLVVAGNFSLDGKLSNIAQYDIINEEWSTKYQSELYLYGESNGVIWDMVVNRTSSDILNTMFVVGAFDTASESSQLQFCSVGGWDGISFHKVGEGLCPRGAESSTTMKIVTTVLGSNGDLFVGGSFESRVWDGRHFVSVYHIAQFDSDKNSWLPLEGGQLQCQNGQEPIINSLAWDEITGILYIGGKFDRINGNIITSGLAIWTESLGVMSFPGGGLWIGDYNSTNLGSALNLAYEPVSQSLFVSGVFNKMNNQDCSNIAVWYKAKNDWYCLFTPRVSVLMPTDMLLSDGKVFISGWAVSSWSGHDIFLPYTVCVLEIDGYIEERRNNGSLIVNNSSTNYLNPYSIRKEAKENSKNDSIKDIKLYRRHLRNNKQRVSNRQLLTKNEGTNPRSFIYTTPSNASISNSSHVPTAAPTVKEPWSPRWYWLPGFKGANGPIMQMTPGKKSYEGCIFLVGGFNNYPAVVIWKDNPDEYITVVNTHHSLQGLVTSVAQVSILYDSEDDSILPSLDYTYYTYMFLVFGVFMGALLGVAFALGVRSKGYSKLSEGSDGESMMIGISLKTLSGDPGGNGLDFRQCFERAMRARHLPTHESLLIINPREIVLSKIIGEGSFGRVWSGQWTNNAVAVKEFVFAQAAIVGGSLERHNIVEEIVGEAGIMACLRHPKILHLYGCSLTMQAIWIVSELCSRGSLRMVLNDTPTELTLLMKLSLCLDVADGMFYLHSRSPPVIHRDLKSHNIFITEQAGGRLVAKIGDWGSARAVALTGAKSMTQGVGTACWLAPEVITNAHSSKDSDVYAFGIVLWEIFTRAEVHDGLSAAQIIAKVAHEHLRPNVPRDCPWAGIMTECWHQEPSSRPSFHKILQVLSKLYARVKAKVEANSGKSKSVSEGGTRSPKHSSPRRRGSSRDDSGTSSKNSSSEGKWNKSGSDLNSESIDSAEETDDNAAGRLRSRRSPAATIIIKKAVSAMGIDPFMLPGADDDDDDTNRRDILQISSPNPSKGLVHKRGSSNPSLFSTGEQEKAPLIKTKREKKQKMERRKDNSNHSDEYSDSEEVGGGYDTT